MFMKCGPVVGVRLHQILFICTNLIFLGGRRGRATRVGNDDSGRAPAGVVGARHCRRAGHARGDRGATLQKVSAPVEYWVES